MNWYGVKWKLESGEIVRTFKIGALSEADARAKLAATYRDELEILKVRLLPNEQARLDQKEFWRTAWENARANMPRRTQDGRGSNTCLMLCLGYKVFTPNKHYGKKAKFYNKKNQLVERIETRQFVNWSNTHLYENIQHGTKPKSEWRQQALLKLAGPYGQLFARRKLKELGVLKQYPYWPKGD